MTQRVTTIRKKKELLVIFCTKWPQNRQPAVTYQSLENRQHYILECNSKLHLELYLYCVKDKKKLELFDETAAAQ